jgi:hypothetical protein
VKRRQREPTSVISPKLGKPGLSALAYALGVIILPQFTKEECARALKRLALPRASHLRSTLAAAPVLFTLAVATEIKIGRIISPSTHASIWRKQTFTVSH